MANRWIADGDSYITLPDPGDIRAAILAGSGFSVTHNDVNIQLPATGYLSSKCGSSSREYGLYISGGNLSFFLGGTDQSIGSVTTLFGTEIVGKLEFSVPDGDNYSLLLDDVVIATGDPLIGASTQPGVLFRVGARGSNNTAADTGGAFQLGSGDKVGDIVVALDGVTETTTTMPITGTDVPATGGNGTLRNASGVTDTDWEAVAGGASVATVDTTSSVQASDSTVSISQDSTSDTASTAQDSSLVSSVAFDVSVGAISSTQSSAVVFDEINGISVSTLSTQQGANSILEAEHSVGVAASSEPQSALAQLVAQYDSIASTIGQAQDSSASAAFGRNATISTTPGVSESGAQAGLEYTSTVSTDAAASVSDLSVSLDYDIVASTSAETQESSASVAFATNNFDAIVGSISSLQSIAAAVSFSGGINRVALGGDIEMLSQLSARASLDSELSANITIEII